MAQNFESIDLTTLEEVHRLLRETDFATIDDVRARYAATGDRPFADASAALPVDPAGASPLPRRR